MRVAIVRRLDTAVPQVEALARLPLAVVVVAAAAEEERSCSTGTVLYASLEPPLLVTPLAEKGRTGTLAQASGEFSISVLGARQADIAVRAAARSDGDKFAEQQIWTVEPRPGRRSPGVAGAVAVFWCDLESAVPAGARLLCVGRVCDSLLAEPPVEPLLRFEHGYRALGARIEVAEEAYYPL